MYADIGLKHTACIAQLDSNLAIKVALMEKNETLKKYIKNI